MMGLPSSTCSLEPSRRAHASGSEAGSAAGSLLRSSSSESFGGIMQGLLATIDATLTGLGASADVLDAGPGAGGWAERGPGA